MIINDLTAYIESEKARRRAADGMSAEDFQNELGVSNTTAKTFIRNEVKAGRLKQNGKVQCKSVDGRVYYKPVYIVVPHEAQT